MYIRIMYINKNIMNEDSKKVVKVLKNGSKIFKRNKCDTSNNSDDTIKYNTVNVVDFDKKLPVTKKVSEYDVIIRYNTVNVKDFDKKLPVTKKVPEHDFKNIVSLGKDGEDKEEDGQLKIIKEFNDSEKGKQFTQKNNIKLIMTKALPRDFSNKIV